MSILNIRYGGEIVPIDNANFNFNPSTYGRARINVKVGTKTEKFGLTTNTNAVEYCKMRMRVGNKVAYLGRVSTVSYISGETPTYNGSSMTLSNSVTNTKDPGSGSVTHPTNPGTPTVTNATGSTVTTKTALASTKYVYWYSATGTNTFNYDPINAHGGNETMSYSYTKTARNTAYATRNAKAGLGPGTSAADPGAATWTNATGSTVVTRRESGNVLTRVDTHNSFYQIVVNAYYTDQNIFDRQFPAVGNNKTYTSQRSNYVTLSQQILTYNYYSLNNPTGAAQARQNAANNAKTLVTNTMAYASFSKSTTRNVNKYTSTGLATEAQKTGAWKTVVSQASTNISRTILYTSSRRTSGKVSVNSTTKTNYLTKETKTYRQFATQAPQALQVWYSSYYSKRWSYWYNTSSVYTVSTYTGTYNQSFSSQASTWNASWTSCRKITIINETVHNMNL